MRISVIIGLWMACAAMAMPGVAEDTAPQSESTELAMRLARRLEVTEEQGVKLAERLLALREQQQELREQRMEAARTMRMLLQDGEDAAAMERVLEQLDDLDGRMNETAREIHRLPEELGLDVWQTGRYIVFLQETRAGMQPRGPYAPDPGLQRQDRPRQQRELRMDDRDRLRQPRRPDDAIERPREGRLEDPIRQRQQRMPERLRRPQ